MCPAVSRDSSDSAHGGRARPRLLTAASGYFVQAPRAAPPGASDGGAPAFIRPAVRRSCNIAADYGCRGGWLLTNVYSAGARAPPPPPPVPRPEGFNAPTGAAVRRRRASMAAPPTEQEEPWEAAGRGAPGPRG